jgi:hypothetical protein
VCAWLGSLVVAIACLSASFVPYDCEPATRTPMSEQLIHAIATADGASVDKLLRRGVDVEVPSLLVAFAQRPIEERLELVEFFARYGSTKDSFMVLHTDAVAGLVGLCRDPDHVVYTEAVSFVAYRVPDDLARDHAAALMRVIETHADDETSAWLAAKLGSARARHLVVEGRVAPGMDRVERDLVLGKLGDYAAEQRSLERYHVAMDPEGDLLESHAWTQNMGRMGTARALIALARDLRHPGVYNWRRGSVRLVRADVVLGLAEAFPREPLIHQELTENEHYARVEEWAEQRLGVTFSEPRPPDVREASPTF